MNIRRVAIIIALNTLVLSCSKSSNINNNSLETVKNPLIWSTLPDIPDKNGFGGMYAGAINDNLIACGGANFPQGPAWQQGQKRWYDTIWMLKSNEKKWKRAQDVLPLKMGYGGYVDYHNSIIILGGYNKKGPFDDVYQIKIVDGNFKFTQLPPLPEPRLYFSSVILDNLIYVIGGLNSTAAKQAKNNFWTLDLSKPIDKRKWVRLQTWPGPPRHLSVAAAAGKSIYIFSGIEILMDQNGEKKLNYLDDAYRYDTISRKWSVLEKMPRPMAASSQSCPVFDDKIFVLSGTDGKLRKYKPQDYPDFKRDYYFYDIKTDSWCYGGKMPVKATLTSPTVKFKGGYAIINGEIRPCIRTNKVHHLKTKP